MQNTASERIRHLVQKRRAEELSKEMLEESLQERDIRDLDTLLNHSLQVLKSSRSRRLEDIRRDPSDKSSEDAFIEFLFGDVAQENAANAVHSEPNLPFIFGQTVYEPTDVHRFDGQLLHFVWDPQTIALGFLRAIDSANDIQTFLNKPLFTLPLGIELPHLFFQDINFGGEVLSIRKGEAPNGVNLTEKWMSFGGFFSITTWNDQISSLITSDSAIAVSEHTINAANADILIIWPNALIPWIGFAWNDRISAIYAP